MSTFTAVMVGIIPSIGVGLIFWFAMRAVIRADRNERAALAREDAEADAAADADEARAADAASELAPADEQGTEADDAPTKLGRDTHPS